MKNKISINRIRKLSGSIVLLAIILSLKSHIANTFSQSKQVDPISTNAAFNNHALRLYSSGDYVEVPSANHLAPAQITIECWINLKGAVGEQTILDKRDANGGYNLRVDGSQYPLGVAVVLKESQEHGLWVGDILQPYTWYHLAATYDGASIKLYLNGELVGSMSVGLNITSTATPLRIGDYLGYPSGSLMFHGLIDDLRLWKKTRTQTEIKSTMNQSLSGNVTGLIGFWNFDDVFGGTIYDLSSYHQHGNLKGKAKCVPSTAPFEDEAQNRAVRLDQPGALVEIPHAAELSPAQLTIECWLKKNATLKDEYTIVDQRGHNSGYNLRLAGTAFPLGVYFILDDGNKSIGFGAPNSINPYIWYHLAASYDGHIAKLFLDGQLVASRAGTPNISQSTANLRLGEFQGYPGAHLELNGDLDELRLWNYARSQAEIQHSMHKNLSAMENGLEGYWRFNEANGNLAYDKTEHENNGTVNTPAKFVTPAAPIGFIPPPAPIGFRAFGSDNYATVHWELPASPDIDHYILYCNSTSNFEPTPADIYATIQHPAAQYGIAPLNNGQRVFCRIQTVDKQGISSRLSPEITVKAAEIHDDYLTGVYYYPWYSNSWGHEWPGQSFRDYLIPPQTPVLGQYDSRNKSVIRQHLDWCKQYGIDLWVCSWWGVNSIEDITIKNYIKPELKADDVKFAVFYESFMLGEPPWVVNSTMETKLRNDYTYIAQTYFNHPNYFKINNQPVVYIYISHAYGGDYVNAFNRIRQTIHNLGYDLFLIGDEIGGSPTDHFKFLDGVTAYAYFGNTGYGIDQEFFGPLSGAFSSWEIAANAQGVTFIPVTAPGFNSRKEGTTALDNSMVIPRQSTAGASHTSFFEEYIQIARPFVDPNLKLIMITSWNEWHEDTQIEPLNTAPPTNKDKSASGTDHTCGYYYEGYGTSFLVTTRKLLARGLLAVASLPQACPFQFNLRQNYPNPFNPTTTIEFALPKSAFVTLKVYNLLGEEVATLVTEQRAAGIHKINWNARNLVSGVYWYRLEAGDFVQSNKLILMR